MTLVDVRTLRAVSQYMSVIEETTNLYTVVSESGSAYTVDLAEPVCTCPDSQYRDTECKHIRRTKIVDGTADVAEVRAALRSSAEELDSEADRLADHLATVRDTASDVRRAQDRLDEVLGER